MASLDIKSPEFWDLRAVDKELRRVYDICGGCRRCLPLCPSFKVLFDRMDVEAVDGDVDKLPAADVKEVVDLCYQCKLCFNHCPYTPPHRWEVDFPRLMLRARAAQGRQSGVSLQDRVLGSADLVGKLGTLTAPLSNWMNELAVHRAFMQAIAGIHKQRNLPRFARPTFSSWFMSRRSPVPAAKAPAAGGAPLGPQGRAVRHVQRRVLRDADGPRRGERDREEPGRRQPAAPAVLRYALPRRRRGRRGQGAHPRQRREPGGGRPRRA